MIIVVPQSRFVKFRPENSNHFITAEVVEPEVAELESDDEDDDEYIPIDEPVVHVDAHGRTPALVLGSILEKWRERRELKYGLALQLVQSIDAGLEHKSVHYRATDGRLLTRLDEVIDAILAGELGGV